MDCVAVVLVCFAVNCDAVFVDRVYVFVDCVVIVLVCVAVDCDAV